MKTKATRVLHPMALFLVVVAVPAFGGEDELLAVKPHLSEELVARVKANPCSLLEEIFRSPDVGKKVCSKRREPNGDLLVAVALKDGEKRVEMMKAGHRCHAGIVGVDDRPRKKPRWVSFLAVDLEATDDKTLAFVGLDVTRKLGEDGSVESIGKGCGAEIEGRVRFMGNKWRLLGPRAEGCSE